MWQSVGLIFDERFKGHLTGPEHPERPERLDAVRFGLETSGLSSQCRGLTPMPISDEALLRVHTPEYLQRLQTACAQGAPFIDDPECPIVPKSHEIARLAAGGVTEAARRVYGGEIKRAFCAVRPPGHHAEADRAMGFCLFNNIAVATRALQKELNAKRILILDWDVHHGNGTQHTFEDDPSVLFISLHGHPKYLYPGTGFGDEIGRDAGKGYTLNVPLPPGTSDPIYRDQFKTRIIPAVQMFAPQIILISAGFDAHHEDPLGNLELKDETFAWLTQTMIELADRYAGGRIVSVLEGGYNLDVLRRCVAEHVHLLLKT